MANGDTRLDATARYLGERGLDGLLAFNNGQNSFLESNAVFVLSGVRPIGESAVLVDRDGGASLILTPAWDEARAAALSRTRVTKATDDLPAALAVALEAHRVDVRKLVTVGLGDARPRAGAAHRGGAWRHARGGGRLHARVGPGARARRARGRAQGDGDRRARL